MTRLRVALLWLFACTAAPAAAQVGLLVGKHDLHPIVPDARVVVMRDGAKTAWTVATSYAGDDQDVALILPVAKPADGRVEARAVDPDLVSRFDAVTAPRLVGIADADPCAPPAPGKPEATAATVPDVRGVLTDARFGDGDVTVQVLAGKDARSPAKWLAHQGYKLPKGADKRLAADAKRGAVFVVAAYHVAMSGKGVRRLKPVQLVFASDAFTLPVAIGQLNAGQRGSALQIYTLTRGGRVETRRPKLLRLPSGLELPDAIAKDPVAFYGAVLDAQTARALPAAVLEYAWDAPWCEHCVADPLTPDELRQAGAFWLPAGARPAKDVTRGAKLAVPGAKLQDAFVTRLKLVYGARPVGDDPELVVTTDKNDVQTRFVIRKAFAGDAACEAGKTYREALGARHAAEAATLGRLTGR